MQPLKFIADMNISPQTVTALKLLGFSITISDTYHRLRKLPFKLISDNT